MKDSALATAHLLGKGEVLEDFFSWEAFAPFRTLPATVEKQGTSKFKQGRRHTPTTPSASLTTLMGRGRADELDHELDVPLMGAEQRPRTRNRMSKMQRWNRPQYMVGAAVLVLVTVCPRPF